MPESDQILDENYGVYYALEDYASFGKRITAWIIDLIILGMILSIYIFLYAQFSKGYDFEIKILFWVSLITAHLYLSVIKNTHASTLGFRISNLKNFRAT